MTWKQIPTIALLSCALWLFADQATRADDVPAWDDQTAAPQRERHDASTYMVLMDDLPDTPPPPKEEADQKRPPRFEEREKIGPPQPENRAQVQPVPGAMPGGGMPAGRAYGPRGGWSTQGPGMYGGPYAPPPQDPEAIKEMQLEERVQQLTNLYRNFDNPQIPRIRSEGSRESTRESTREEIQKTIEELVAQQFDLRQERRQKELKRFEEQIKKLRETIEKRQKARTEIIDRHVKDLLGQDDDMKF
jgi:ribosomal protein L29